MQFSERLAGVVAMSGYLPAAEKFQLSEAAKDVPVLLGHGTADPMVKYEFAEQTRDGLIEMGATNVVLKSYPGMGHSVCMEEIHDVETFLRSVLPGDAGVQAHCDADDEKSIHVPLGENVRGDKSGAL